MKKTVAALFLLTSTAAWTMDNDAKKLKLTQSAPPKKVIFEKIPANIIKPHIVFKWLNAPDFCAFMQTCQTAHAMINQKNNPDFYLSSDPEVLLRQLSSFISPDDGKVMWDKLLFCALRTKDAVKLLAQAGKTYLQPTSESYISYRILLDDTWKLSGFALLLADVMGDETAAKSRTRILSYNEQLLKDKRDESWKYFLPSIPHKHFEASQTKAYELICEAFTFGQAWNLGDSKRYWTYAFTAQPSRAKNKFQEISDQLCSILSLGQNEQPEDKNKKIWFLFNKTDLEMKEKHLKALLNMLRRNRAKIKALGGRDASSDEKAITSLKKEEGMLVEMLRKRAETLSLPPFHVHSTYYPAQAALEANRALVYEGIGETDKAAKAYYQAGSYASYTNNKDGALAYFLKAIALFQNIENQRELSQEDKKELARAYGGAAQLFKDLHEQRTYCLKAAGLFQEIGDDESAKTWLDWFDLHQATSALGKPVLQLL